MSKKSQKLTRLISKCKNQRCTRNQETSSSHRGTNWSSYALGYLSCCRPPSTQGTPALLHEEQDGTRPSHYQNVSQIHNKLFAKMQKFSHGKKVADLDLPPLTPHTCGSCPRCSPRGCPSRRFDFGCLVRIIRLVMRIWGEIHAVPEFHKMANGGEGNMIVAE